MSLTKSKYVSSGPNPKRHSAPAANGGKTKSLGMSPKAPGGVVTSRLNAGGDMKFKGSRGSMKSGGAKY